MKPLRARLVAIVITFSLASGCRDTTGPLFPVHFDIAAGSAHTCRLAPNGLVSCWGDNAYGQLGQGRFGYSTVPIAVPQ